MRPWIACGMCFLWLNIAVVVTFGLLCVNGLIGFGAIVFFCLTQPLVGWVLDKVGGAEWVRRSGGRR